MAKSILKEIRVKHYVKNVLVFAALFCGGQILNYHILFKNVLGFLLFCFCSSMVYIINDLKDIEKDRLHPRKCHRPIAAGEITKRQALLMLAVLMGLACGISVCLHDWVASAIMLVFVLLNVLYSFGLKNKPIVDIAILTFGFVIRVLFGAVISGIQISNWLYLTILSGAFFFSLGKRRNEIQMLQEGETRAVLKLYTKEFLDKNMYMFLALTNVFYALWSIDGQTIETYGNRNIVLSVPIVYLILMKYSLDIEGVSDGDPVEVLMHDKVLIVLLLIYFLMMFLLLYIF